MVSVGYTWEYTQETRGQSFTRIWRFTLARWPHEAEYRSVLLFPDDLLTFFLSFFFLFLSIPFFFFFFWGGGDL